MKHAGLFTGKALMTLALVFTLGVGGCEMRDGPTTYTYDTPENTLLSIHLAVEEDDLDRFKDAFHEPAEHAALLEAVFHTARASLLTRREVQGRWGDEALASLDEQPIPVAYDFPTTRAWFDDHPVQIEDDRASMGGDFGETDLLIRVDDRWKVDVDSMMPGPADESRDTGIDMLNAVSQAINEAREHITDDMTFAQFEQVLGRAIQEAFGLDIDAMR
ncbi:MAG: hypothetical protein JJU36_07545 [Phycisphaeraceae bacterium]|nr:hypothetical protein [Phycisphaeraceae bacterium]